MRALTSYLLFENFEANAKTMDDALKRFFCASKLLRFVLPDYFSLELQGGAYPNEASY